MSADNWTVCPDCNKRANSFRDKFREKYYGKLDSFVYTRFIREIDRAVTHMESYSSDEFKPDKELLRYGDENNIFIEYKDAKYDIYEICQQDKISCSLREDYEQGVDDNGMIYIRYSCSCDCGFDKDYKYDEKEGEDKK